MARKKKEEKEEDAVVENPSTVGDDVVVDKKVNANGKFQVVKVSKGKLRGFNPVGQAVTGIVDATEVKQVADLRKFISRSSTLYKRTHPQG